MSSKAAINVVFLSLFVSASFALVQADPQAGAYPFFVFDNGVGRGEWAPEKQASVLKQLGYQGISYNLTTKEALAHWQRAFRDEGLKIFGVYVRTWVDGPQRYQAELREAIEVLKGSDTIIWMTLQNRAAHQDGFDEQAVEIVSEVAGWAAEAGLRVALYPHRGYYVETAEDALRIFKQLKCKNVGISFNLIHELSMGNLSRLDEIIAKTAPHLYLVSINGADTAALRENKVLGQGNVDVSAVLHQLKAAGYAGPIGLQAYKIPGDTEENLKRSIAAWTTMKQAILVKAPQ